QGLVSVLNVAIDCVMLRVSVRYHARCVRKYWNAAQSTHANMAPETFDFYADHIAELIGGDADNGLILDHGAGRGEIGTRLMQKGYDVEFSELSDTFLDHMRSNGLTCYNADHLPASRYRVCFANNSIFYTHPRRLLGGISRLLQCLQSG